MKKKIIGIVLFVVLAGVGKYVYDVNINHNFKEICEGKVYKSGVIPPDEIEDYIKKYNIKSIIDLRNPGTKDSINNPEVYADILAEQAAVEKLKGVNYYNVRSLQIPNQKTLDYPLLIHCHHGEGRAPLFAAIYRIEYENMPNEEARKKTCVVTLWSNFDDDNPKGEFLKNYKKRNTNK